MITKGASGEIVNVSGTRLGWDVYLPGAEAPILHVKEGETAKLAELRRAYPQFGVFRLVAVRGPS